MRVVGGRVAAKEAISKALGSGFAGEVSWQDIEILETDAGAPTVELSGGALELARSLGVQKLVVSISHARTVAVASAIAVGSGYAFPKNLIAAMSKSNDTLPPWFASTCFQVS